MANRDVIQARISKELEDYLENLSERLTNESKSWRNPVKKTEASRYLAQLLNKKSTLRLRRKGKNIIEMDLRWKH